MYQYSKSFTKEGGWGCQICIFSSYGFWLITGRIKSDHGIHIREKNAYLQNVWWRKELPLNVFWKALKSYIFNSFICCTFVEKLVGLKCGHNGSLVESEQMLFPLPLARSLWFSVHTSVAAFFSWSSTSHRLLETWKKGKWQFIKDWSAANKTL